LSAFLIIVVSGCGRNSENETAANAAGAPSDEHLGSQHETAGSLIRRYVEQPDGRHVAVEINTEALQNLMTRPSRDTDLQAFRDPLPAARLFAPHIGLPAGADFVILEISQYPEEGSGLFIAVVQVTGGDKQVQMRMVSEPDAYEQPTLWVLNDYRR
jgi:hypothetical protein